MRTTQLGLATLLGALAVLSTAATARAEQFNPVPAPGYATSIGVGPGGAAWIIGTSSAGSNGNGIFDLEGTTWHPDTPGDALIIAVSPVAGGIPYVVNNLGQVFKWQTPIGERTGFYPLAGGTPHGVRSNIADSIGVGPDGNPWVLDANVSSPTSAGAIYRYTGSAFVQVAGIANLIAVSSSGTPFAVNGEQVFEWTGGNPSGGTGEFSTFPLGQTQVPLTETIVSIGVGPNDDPWLIGKSQAIYHWNGSTWQQQPTGLATQVAVSPEGVPWVINASNQIFEGAAAGPANTSCTSSEAAANTIAYSNFCDSNTLESSSYGSNSCPFFGAEWTGTNANTSNQFDLSMTATLSNAVSCAETVITAQILGFEDSSNTRIYPAPGWQLVHTVTAQGTWVGNECEFSTGTIDNQRASFGPNSLVPVSAVIPNPGYMDLPVYNGFLVYAQAATYGATTTYSPVQVALMPANEGCL